jgi:5'-phosphate synthase pdxT subunit
VQSFEADLEISELQGERFRAVFIRAPAIAEVGPDVEVLARLDDGTIVAVRQGRILATSFHPELGDDLRLHQHFLRFVE